MAIFCWEISKFRHQQKYLCKYIKISKIGAMLRSFFQPALPSGSSHKDPIVYLDWARPAYTCILPSFPWNAPVKLHGIPTPKIYRPIWQHLRWIAKFFVAKLLEVKFFVDNYLAMEWREKKSREQNVHSWFGKRSGTVFTALHFFLNLWMSPTG